MCFEGWGQICVPVQLFRLYQGSNYHTTAMKQHIPTVCQLLTDQPTKFSLNYARLKLLIVSLVLYRIWQTTF